MSSNFKLCEPCLYIKEEEAATGFCLTCAEYLCRGCIKEHKKAKLTREHSLLQDNIPENAEILRDLKDMTICKNHAGISVTHFCKEHNDFICAVCCFEKHSTCKMVDKLTEDTKSGENNVDMQVQLEATINIIREFTEKAYVYKKSLDLDKLNILEEKAELKAQVILKLNEVDNKCTEELNKAFDSVSSEIEKDVKELKNLEQSCVRQQEVLKTSMESGRKNEATLISRILAEKINNLETKVTCLERRSQQRLKLEKNPALLNIEPFGRISVVIQEIINESVCTQTEMSSDEITEQEAIIHTESCITTVLDSLHEISLNPSPTLFNISEVDENNPCDIEGTHVTDKYILLLDRNNTKLKLLSPECSVLYSIKLPGRPLRCCKIGQDVFAVSFLNVKRINRYEINISGNSIIYLGGFNTNLYNNGMSWNGENIVGLMTDVEITAQNNAKHDIIELHILNPYDGTILQQTRDFIVCGPSNSSVNLRNTLTMLLTDENDLIVAERNRILCFSIENDVHGIFAKEKRYFLGGNIIPRNDIMNIAVDNERIYVGTESGVILQLSTHDYTEARVVIAGLPCIKSLQVDKQRRRIIVTCEEDDNIRVYSVK